MIKPAASGNSRPTDRRCSDTLLPSTWPSRAERRTPSTCRSTAPTGSSRATGASPRPARARRPPSAGSSLAEPQDHARGLGHHIGRAREPRVHRDLPDDDAGVHGPQTQAGPLARHHLHAQTTSFQDEHVVGLLVLSDQHGSLWERDGARGASPDPPACRRARRPTRRGTSPVRFLPRRRPFRQGRPRPRSRRPRRRRANLPPDHWSPVQVRFEPDDPLGRDDPAALQCLRTGSDTREHELELSRLRQVHHLDERHHRGGARPRGGDRRPGTAAARSPRACGCARAGCWPIRRTRTRSRGGSGHDRSTPAAPLARRAAVDVAAVRLPERNLAHQLDPAVADCEQDDREHQADHDAGQEYRPLRGSRDDPVRRAAGTAAPPTRRCRRARGTPGPRRRSCGISSMTGAPNTTAASGTSAAMSPARRALTSWHRRARSCWAW